jgi:hypothetical protein
VSLVFFSLLLLEAYQLLFSVFPFFFSGSLMVFLVPCSPFLNGRGVGVVL